MRTGPHGLEEQRLENRRRVGLYSLGPQRKKNREIQQGFEKTSIHVKTSIMSDTHPDHDLCLSSQQHPGPTWPTWPAEYIHSTSASLQDQISWSRVSVHLSSLQSSIIEETSVKLTEFVTSLQRRTPNINDSNVEYTA